MKPQEAARIVAYLTAAFPNSKIDADRAGLYSLMLTDLERDEAEQVAAEIVRMSHWFPSVGDFQEVALRRRLAIPGMAEVRTQVADKAEWAREREGEAPELHPLVARALDLMGGTFSLRSADNPGVWWAQFKNLYSELREQVLREENLRSAGIPAAYEPGLYPISDLGDTFLEATEQTMRELSRPGDAV